MRVSRPVFLTLVGGLAVVLVGAPAGAGLAAYRSDAALQGVLPGGSVVGGVDVSRMTRADAVAAVTAKFAPQLTRSVSIRVAGREYSVTPRELGVEYDVAEAVDKAFAHAATGSWLSRAWDKLRKEARSPVVPVAVAAPSQDRIEQFVDDIAEQVAVEPRDAAATVSGGWVRFTPAKQGARLDTAAAAAALRTALAEGTTPEVALDAVAPDVTDAEFETVILVRAGENKLYLYKGGRIVRSYGVATGSPRYPTPTGRYEVTLKRYRPTWVNPWSKWSMDMPARIGPGPNNPLGTRALNINAPGIRIHGTPAANSIGYSVSHGCIRMRMPDVEDLYPRVATGTPVFIVQAGPHRPMTRRTSTPADAADGG